MTTRRLPRQVSGFRFVQTFVAGPRRVSSKSAGVSVRHRLNVMQGGASMAPPVARCSNGHTPCWRILARVIGSPMFLRARVALRGRICVRSRLLARAFARVLRGFELMDRFADEHGYARASFSTPQSGKWNWPECVVKIVALSALRGRKLPCSACARNEAISCIASCLAK
jgi:hypothetical protein